MKNGNEAANRLRLLLVDDEEAYVNVLCKRMARRNIDVTPALNSSTAIRLLRGREFDAAVLDFRMEDMDGIELLKIFKKMDPGMPVIIVTGHGSEATAREGLSLGAFDYLTKPCLLEDLIERIQVACRDRNPSMRQ